MRPRLLLTAVFTVLGGGLLLTAWLLVEAKQTAWTHAAQVSTNLTEALSRDIEHQLDTYDHLLQSVQDDLREPTVSALPPAALQTLLADRASVLGREMGVLLITDETGLVRYSAPLHLPANMSVDGRDFFQAQRVGGDDHTFTGKPFRGKLTGQETIGLSRRLSDPDGGFAGVVAGTLRLSALRDMFERVRMEQGGSIALLHTDGTLLVQVPFSTAPSGRILAGANVVTRIQSGPATGSFEDRSRLDGTPRLYSYARVGASALHVVVATPMIAVYAAWRQQAMVVALVELPLLFAALLLAWSLSQELERRSRAERRATESVAEFRATFDHSADGLFLLRVLPAGRFVLERANNALTRMWGLPPVAMQGREPRSFLSAPVTAQVEQHWMACVETGEPVRYALSTDQTGRRLELETVVTPVRDADGQVSLLLGSTHDTTERIELTRQLAQAQRMEAVGRMSAGITHDFNNLLQTITLGVRDMVTQSPDSELRRQLVTALRAVEHGAELTRRLFSFSREQRPEPRTLDPAAMIGNLRELITWSVGTRVQVQVVIGPGLWAAHADQMQLEMCLLNLASNARDAMPGGGQLVLRARNAPAREATRAGLSVADHVVISIQDTGAGMDAVTRTRVFDAFFTTKQVDRGSGLGLWMVRGFARAAGGDVRIESEPGRGTQVSLWLPRATDKIVAGAPKAPAPALPIVAGTPGRVLLVDDDQMVRDALTRLLEEAGHDVLAVPGSEQALRLLSTSDRLDLLIADQSIPGISGTELITTAWQVRPGLPCMVITGYARLSEIPPNVRVLHKPIDPDSLLAEVSALISPAAASLEA